MPWQPFRRRRNKYRQVGEPEAETSFDTELLPRSASDGNLVRAPSERFLLQNSDPRKSYGTCTGSSNTWSHFLDHSVTEGETLAGLSLKYNITIQDIKLCNKIWTNEGLWPGRLLRIPLSEGVAAGGLDLSGSETMSLDSQQSHLSESAAGCSHSSSDSSRRLSNHSNNDSGLFPDSPVSLPLKLNSPRNKLSQNSLVSRASTSANNPSVEDLSDFLSKMDSCIAVNKRTADSLIKSSALETTEADLNNTHTRLEDSFDTETGEAVCVSVRSDSSKTSSSSKTSNGVGRSTGMSSGPSMTSLKQAVRGQQGYQNIC